MATQLRELTQRDFRVPSATANGVEETSSLAGLSDWCNFMRGIQIGLALGGGGPAAWLTWEY